MYGYVYLLTNKINDMKYIGIRASSIVDESYYGSGVRIRNAVNKYGVDNFQREILHWCDTPEELILMEVRELKDRNAANSSEYYNLIDTPTPILFGEANGFYGKVHSLETKKVLSNKAKNRKHTAQSLKNLRDYWCSEEGEKQKQKLREKRTGVALSADHKEKIKQSLADPKKREEISNRQIEFYQTEKGAELKKTYSEKAKKRFSGVRKTKTHKQNISKSLKGKSRDNPQNKNPEKIRKTAEKHRGMKRSEEAKSRMSKSAKKRGANNKGCIWIYHPDTSEKRMVKNIENIPDGFIKGYGPRKK